MRPNRRLTGLRRLASTEPSNLLHIFWLLVAVFLVYWAVTSLGRPASFNITALLLIFVSLLPAYLWCQRIVTGIPIFPFFAGAFLLTHAMQFMLAEPKIREYPADSIWRAGLTVSGFLLVATLVWLLWARLPRQLPPSCRVLDAQRGTSFLFLILTMSTGITIFNNAGWLENLPGGLLTMATQFFRGPTSFAMFVLAMRWGGRTLNPPQTRLFICLFVTYCIADASSLFLVSVVIACLMLVLGFVLGRKSLPWFWLLPMVLVIGFLHIGKGEMRSRYWAAGSQGNLMQPWDYPAFYGEWCEASLSQMIYQKQSGEESQSVLSRANTVYLLLQAQEMAPAQVPFLDGATYAIIPSAMVPRIFNPDKASPHDGTSLLNVHFGNQTWEAAQKTSMGWGLLNEAFANFGYWGCFMLAVVLGTFYGLVTRWGIGPPPTSVSSLVGIFTLSFALQTEMNAAVYITAYLQGLFALLLLAWPFTERVSLLPEGKENRSRKRMWAEKRRTENRSR